jgi:hypothetical protein
MRRITEQIRDYINGPRMSYLLRQDMGNWNQICSSLDVIEDTDLAISAYLSNRPDDADSMVSVGNNYLKLYGLLQALFLQQDAVSHLCEALSVPYDPNQFPRLKPIRDARNASIGHPTQRGTKTKRSHHFVSRISISHEGYTLLSVFPNDDIEAEDINVHQFIDHQRSDVEVVLTSVADALRQRVAEHEATLMDHRFADVFPGTLGYTFEKLFEAFRAPERSIGAGWSVGVVEGLLQDFRDALKAQDMDIDTFPFVELVYDEMQFPIAQLKAYLEGSDSEIRSDRMALIVAFYVKAKVDELRSLAQDLDAPD